MEWRMESSVRFMTPCRSRKHRSSLVRKFGPPDITKFDCHYWLPSRDRVN
jgi:hypothetical protein